MGRGPAFILRGGGRVPGPACRAVCGLPLFLYLRPLEVNLSQRGKSREH